MSGSMKDQIPFFDFCAIMKSQKSTKKVIYGNKGNQYYR